MLNGSSMLEQSPKSDNACLAADPATAAIIDEGYHGMSSLTSQLREDTHWTPRRRKFMAQMYSLANLLLYATRTALPLCMPVMKSQFGWDKQQQGLVMGTFLWGYPVTQVLGGYLADRFGAEKIILLGTCGWSIATLLTPIVPFFGPVTSKSSLYLIVVTRLCQGLFQGVHYPSVMSALSKHVPDNERTFIYSVISSGSHCGLLFIGLAGSIILERIGWSSVFYLLGSLGLLWVLIMYIFRDTRNAADLPVRKEADGTSTNPGSEDNKIPWGLVLRQPPFWAMIMAHNVFGATYSVFLFWLPSFFREKFPTSQLWIHNTLPWIASLTAGLSFGWLSNLMIKKNYSKTFTRKSFNVIAMLVFGVLLICISHVSTYPALVLTFCLAAAANGAYQTTISMCPSDILPKHAGVIFGIMNTCGAVSGFIGTYLSGAMLEHTVDWGLMYTVTGWVSIAGWAVFAYWGSADPIL